VSRARRHHSMEGLQVGGTVFPDRIVLCWGHQQAEAAYQRGPKGNVFPSLLPPPHQRPYLLNGLLSDMASIGSVSSLTGLHLLILEKVSAGAASAFLASSLELKPPCATPGGGVNVSGGTAEAAGEALMWCWHLFCGHGLQACRKEGQGPCRQPELLGLSSSGI